MRPYLLFLAALPLRVAAQWQPISVPVTTDLYSIDGLDAQQLCIGTTGSWLRSADGGAGWEALPLNDALGIQLVGSTFFAMDYRSTDELLGVGLSLLDTHPFEVRRSTNAGDNWPTAYTAMGNGLLSHFNGMAFSGSTGVAVGDLGRIIRSTDGGASWTAVNSSGDEFYDVAWPTATSVVVVGDGRIMRSTNSGQTWSTVFTGSDVLYAVSFVSATTGYAAGTEGDLLRTTNGGGTWLPLDASLPLDLPAFQDLWFTSTTEAYGLCGELVVHSTDGGLHWAWFDGGAEMHQLYFTDATNGFAVGDAGTLYHTGGSGDYHPYALMTGPGFVCHDSLTTFTSDSGPGLTQQWFVNGALAGTGVQLDWTFTTPEEHDTVLLVVGNGTWTDTVEQVVSVGINLTLDVEASMDTDTVCSGNSTTVQVPASVLGVSYRLYRGNDAQGNAQNGNGNTLSFSTGTMNTPQTFHLVGTRNGGSCGTATDTVSFFVGIGNPIPTLEVTPDEASVCQGDIITINVAGTQVEVAYQLRLGTAPIGAAQQGNGGELSFTLGPIQASGTYSVYAVNADNTCTSTLQQTVPVSVEVPLLAWGPTSMNPVAGASVDLMNSSDALGGTYVWDLPGGTPSTSTVAEPQGVVFASPGLVPVTLVGITPNGCTDSLTKVLHVIEQPQAQECAVSQLSLNGGDPHGALGLDPAGNMFAWMQTGGSHEFISFSGGQDTLYSLLPTESGYGGRSLLLKYDSLGVPQWWVDLRSGMSSGGQSDVMADADGNVYAAYFHNAYEDSLHIVDVSGHDTIFRAGFQGGVSAVITMSFTPQGRLRWVNRFGAYYPESVNMEMDGQGHLLVQSADRMVQYDRATGQQIWEVVEQYGFRDITVTPDDHILVVERFNMVMREYDNAGELVNTTPAYVPTPNNMGTASFFTLESAGDNLGNIYQVHNLWGTVVLGTDTITSDQPGFVQVLTRSNAAGEVLWARAIATQYVITIQGLVASDERMLLSMTFSQDDDVLHMEGLPDTPVTLGDTWLLSILQDGSDPQLVRIYAHNGTFNSMYINGTNAITLSPDGERLALWASFLDPLYVGNDGAFNYDHEFFMPQGPKNDGLVFGAVDCLLAGPPPMPPQAFFTPPTGYCQGQDIPFTDGSLLAPTSWAWEFPGGTPPISTAPDPVVSYALPGTYTVTLIATNANGSSEPYVADVFVDICSGVPDGAAPHNWRAWPSPADGIVHLRGPSTAMARLLDLQGRLVWSGSVCAEDELDVRALAPGGYLLSVGEERLRIVVAR